VLISSGMRLIADSWLEAARRLAVRLADVGTVFMTSGALAACLLIAGKLARWLR